MTDIVDTAAGPAIVLHRLALAVECRDALSDRPAGTPVTVRYRRRPAAADPDPAWRPLQMAGGGRFALRHRIPGDPARPLPDLQIVVDDPSRRYVPRRFTVTPWTYAEVKDTVPDVPARSRLLRLWLRPGSAYAFPLTATVIRGRVARAGDPVRWARVQGTTATSVAGWAHTDERGEFVLPLADLGFDPVRDSQLEAEVALTVVAPTDVVPPDPNDRTADLPSEVIARSANPATGQELDNAVLRGAAVPAGYGGNRAATRQVTVPVGAEVNLTEDVLFDPQP